jgi:hypothetical protein
MPAFTPLMLAPLMFAPFVPTPTAIIIIIGPCWSTGCDHPENAYRRYDCRDRPHDHLLALMLAALRHANEPTPKLRQDRDEFAAGLWRPNSEAHFSGRHQWKALSWG